MNISKQLINGFIRTELELFKNQFNQPSVPEIQEDRSLAIAWLCYYFKDIVSSENASSIIEFLDEVRFSDNYDIYGWYRIPALQASAFILTSNIYYAKLLIQNISCTQSWAREFIIKSAGIICPLLSFDFYHLKEVTELNIINSHFFCKENILLYLSTNGSLEHKISWFEHQISIVEHDDQKKLLNSIKKEGRFNNSMFFVSAFNRTKSYIIFKMLCHPSLYELQPTLFDNVDIAFNELAELEKIHPLNDYYIDLSYLNKAK